MGHRIVISQDKKFVMLFRYTDSAYDKQDKYYNRIFAVKDIVSIVPSQSNYEKYHYTYQKRLGYNITLTNKETIWINDAEYFELLSLIGFDTNQIDESKKYMREGE